MESLLEAIAHITTWQRATLIGGGFLALWTLEMIFGATRFPRYRHARTNLVFWGTTLLINAALSGLTLGTSFAITQARFGLLSLFAMPAWLNLLAHRSR
jgi:hypothetical protein